MDFDKIVFSKAEMELLENLEKDYKTLKRAPNAALKRLIRLDFAVEEFFKENLRNRVRARITDLGRDYLMYTRNLQHQLDVANRRFLITTIIAVVALLNSVVSEIILALDLL